MRISEIIKQYSTQEATKTAGAAPMQTDRVKVAQEAGVRDADNLMKVASLMGDVIGERVVARVAESFGYDPEVMKVASLQDLIYDTITKVAEQVTGTTPNGAVATQHAETLQVVELAAHHANLAAQSANDAIQSLAQGDEHTATQAMNTAANAIEVAKNLASRVDVGELHNHVDEAAQIVSEAADAAAQHAAANGQPT